MHRGSIRAGRRARRRTGGDCWVAGVEPPGTSENYSGGGRGTLSQSPFAKSSNAVSASANRRRSTRIEFVVPIIISGRNASGQTYREATETTAVSAHGAALKTRNPILIGMQLMVENLWDGIAEKAICIRVMEAETGHDQHGIAIQLLHPRNIWGVKDPPADWQFALGPTEQALVQAAAPGGPHLAPAAGTNPAPYSPTPAMLDLEHRSSELVESVLSLLRRRTAEILQEALKEFEDRLKTLEGEAEERMAEHSGEALSGTELSLSQMRQEMLQQIKAQADQAAILAEDSIRARVGELFLPRSKTAHDLGTEKRTGEGPTE